MVDKNSAYWQRCQNMKRELKLFDEQLHDFYINGIAHQPQVFAAYGSDALAVYAENLAHMAMDLHNGIVAYLMFAKELEEADDGTGSD